MSTCCRIPYFLERRQQIEIKIFSPLLSCIPTLVATLSFPPIFRLIHLSGKRHVRSNFRAEIKCCNKCRLRSASENKGRLFLGRKKIKMLCLQVWECGVGTFFPSPPPILSRLSLNSSTQQLQYSTRKCRKNKSLIIRKGL